MIDDLSRGWWDVLCASLAYPRLKSFAVDVTLDRPKNDWSKPWSAQDVPRLPIHNGISGIIVALSFADRKFKGPYEGSEYLCRDMSNKLIASAPLLTNLRLLHQLFGFAADHAMSAEVVAAGPGHCISPAWPNDISSECA